MASAGALGMLSGCGEPPQQQAEARPPNIIYIMLDDLGYADFGCYGSEHLQTPHVDHFRTESMKFTDCYAGAAVCAPCRSVLMTGYHTGHGSVRANAGTAPILAEDVTVAELLKKAGYRTGVFGKWGLGDAHTTGVPDRQGFDESFGYLHQIHAHDYYTDFLWKNGEKYPLPGNAGGKQEQYSADIIFEESLNFLRGSKDQPFFLYGAYTLPHGKWEIPSDAPYTGKDWPQVAKNYAAMVTKADDHIGRLLAELKTLGLEDDTIVFVTSDNGGTQSASEYFNCNKPLRDYKGSTYEGGLRVPMLARWPGKIAPGSESDVPWYFCDFMPTACELAGAQAPAGIDGVSVLPALMGSSEPLHEFMYWEHHAFNRQKNDIDLSRMMQGVRYGDWKAVIPKPGELLELYNLKEDISESNNVAAANPDVAAKIQEYLKTARTEARPQVGGTFEFATS